MVRTRYEYVFLFRIRTLFVHGPIYSTHPMYVSPVRKQYTGQKMARNVWVRAPHSYHLRTTVVPHSYHVAVFVPCSYHGSVFVPFPYHFRTICVRAVFVPEGIMVRTYLPFVLYSYHMCSCRVRTNDFLCLVRTQIVTQLSCLLRAVFVRGSNRFRTVGPQNKQMLRRPNFHNFAAFLVLINDIVKQTQ